MVQQSRNYSYKMKDAKCPQPERLISWTFFTKKSFFTSYSISSQGPSSMFFTLFHPSLPKKNDKGCLHLRTQMFSGTLPRRGQSEFRMLRFTKSRRIIRDGRDEEGRRRRRRNKKNEIKNRNSNKLGGRVTDVGINLSPCGNKRGWCEWSPSWTWGSLWGARHCWFLCSDRQIEQRPKQAAYVLLTSEWCIACRDPLPRPPPPNPTTTTEAAWCLSAFSWLLFSVLICRIHALVVAENAGRTDVAFFFSFFFFLQNGGGHNGPNNASAGTVRRIKPTTAPIDGGPASNSRCAGVHRSARISAVTDVFSSCFC